MPGGLAADGTTIRRANVGSRAKHSKSSPWVAIVQALVNQFADHADESRVGTDRLPRTIVKPNSAHSSRAWVSRSKRISMWSEDEADRGDHHIRGASLRLAFAETIRMSGSSHGCDAGPLRSDTPASTLYVQTFPRPADRLH